MKWRIFALLVTLCAASAEAEIYKWILPDGSIEYSDRPPAEGAEKVELSPLVTYTAPPVSANPEESPQADTEFDGYDSFTIASPANDATIRDNAGNVSLNFAVTPSLIQGHAIDIFLDGRKFGRSNAPLVTLANLSRGNHQIYAVIVDDTGAELARTGTLSINLQRVSKLLEPDAIVDPVIGGARSPGGAKSPGGPRSSGGPQSPGGPASPGGPKSGGGATPTL